MATRSLGTLTLDLVAKIGGFTQGMDQASRVADKRMRDIERRAYSFGKNIGESIRGAAKEFLAFAGLSLTVGAAFESLKKAIDLADETRDLSIRLGVSTQSISDFRYAAQQTGTDMETLGKGMKILAKNAADALNPTSAQAKIFTALGISVTDASGNLKQLDVLLPEVADKFKGLEDGTTKAALAQALFGKSGLDLTEFLDSGSAGLKEYGDHLRELGGEITPEAAAQADAFNDKLNDLKTAFGGVALKVAGDLLPELNKLVQNLIDISTDGEETAAVAHDIASGFDAMVTAAHSIGVVVGWFEKLRDVMNQIDSFTPVSSDNPIANFLKGHFPSLYAQPGSSSGSTRAAPSNFQSPDYLQIPGIAPFSATNTFSATTGTGNVPRTDSRAVALALSNPSAAHASVDHSAEKVAAAIQQMTKAQQEWEAELSKTGNPIADEYADRLRQIAEDGAKFTKDGVPADKVAAFTAEMTKLAGSLRDADLVKFQKDFDEETASMAANLSGPGAAALQTYESEVAKLDLLMKQGAITADEYNKRVSALAGQRDSAATGVLKDLQTEIDLLGATNEQRDTYNRLAYAGVTANSELGQAIVDQTHKLHEQGDAMQVQIGLMDDFRSGAVDALTAFVTGTKSASEALKDFFNDLAAQVTRAIANQWIKQLFGEQGSSGSGTSGGSWISAIFGAFGGGKAGGGTVTPGRFYEVGEGDRPEMLMSGGRQYMIPGNQGRVVPMGAGGGVTQNININYAAPYKATTAAQSAQRMGYEAKRALSRNG